MKKLSLWAKRHPWNARILIVVSFLVLNATGIGTGLWLKEKGILLPLAFLLLFAVIYAIAFIGYPRKPQNRRCFYRQQKTCDMLLAASTFFMILYLGNHPDQVFHYRSPFAAAMASIPVQPADSVKKLYKPLHLFAASMKDPDGKLLKWKERKKLLKEQIKSIRRTEGLSRSGETALIIVSLLVAVGLLYLVAALACNLSCNGSDAAAVIVGVGGAALIIFLAIVVIRKITGKKKKKIKNPENEPPAN